MKQHIKWLAALAVVAVIAVASSKAQQPPTVSYFVEKLATNYSATIVSGTNAASGEILSALSGTKVYTRITVRPTGAVIAIGQGATATTNSTPQYGVGTNYTWTASDMVTGPFRTNAVYARDIRAGTNATSTADVEAWYIDWK